MNVGWSLILSHLVSELQGNRRYLIRRGLALLLGIVLFLAGCIILGMTILYGWQTGDWFRTLSILDLPLAGLFCVFAVICFAFYPEKRWLPLIDSLRQAIAEDDDNIAPLAEPQPIPLTADELTAFPSQFEHLRSLATAREKRERFLFWLNPAILLVGIEFSGILHAFGIVWPIDSPLEYLFPLSGLLCVGILPLSILGIINDTRGFLSITVDETGMRWRRKKRGSDELFASWSAARSFAYASANGSYVLDLGEAILGWGILRKDGVIAAEESEQLARLIVTRTDLPLRDLSQFAALLKETGGRRKRLQQVGISEQLSITFGAMRKLNAFLLKRYLLMMLIICPIFLGLFSLFHLPDVQQSYIIGLVPKIHTASVLYHDTLHAQDGSWPTQQPAKQNGYEQISFINNTYQLGTTNSTDQSEQNIQQFPWITALLP